MFSVSQLIHSGMSELPPENDEIATNRFCTHLMVIMNENHSFGGSKLFNTSPSPHETHVMTMKSMGSRKVIHNNVPRSSLLTGKQCMVESEYESQDIDP